MSVFKALRNAAEAWFLPLLCLAVTPLVSHAQTAQDGQALPPSPVASQPPGEVFGLFVSRWWYLLVILFIVAYLSRRQGEAGHQLRVQKRVHDAYKAHEERQQAKMRNRR